MKKFVPKIITSLAICSSFYANAQITLLQDYQNNTSDTIGTYQNILFREGGFSTLYPIPDSDGKDFWICSDRGVNIDCADANPDGCHPTYDKLFAFPDYAPKIHHIRIDGDSIQIIQTITMKRPDGTDARGVLNPAGFGSTEAEEASTDTVNDCADFDSKIADKDVWALDPEGLVKDSAGNFWVGEENGPAIWKMDSTGKVLKRYTPYAGQEGASDIDAPIDTVFKYRNNNRGFESMAMTPNGKIYTIIQSPLFYPDDEVGEHTRVHRLLELDPATGATKMYAYLNDGEIGSGNDKVRLKDWKIGDMAAINDSTFLVIEAGTRGNTDIKKIYLINIAQATPITSGLYNGLTAEALVDSEGLTAQGIMPVQKTLFLDLKANGWPTELDKSEGLAIINDSTIAVCNDNDFGQVSPEENGIATAINKLSHVFVYGLQGDNKVPGLVSSTTPTPSGVHDVEAINSVLVFPNPANTLVNVQFSLVKQCSIEISVTDVYGRPAMPAVNKLKVSGNDNVQISTANIASGTYFLTLRSGQQIKQVKLAVIH